MGLENKNMKMDQSMKDSFCMGKKMGWENFTTLMEHVTKGISKITTWMVKELSLGKITNMREAGKTGKCMELGRVNGLIKMGRLQQST